MKTEKEVRELAHHYQECARIAAESSESSENAVDRGCYLDVCTKYNHMFAALATVLGIGQDDLWYEIHVEDKRDKIPLHTRLQGLTNPARSGMILEPKE